MIGLNFGLWLKAMEPELKLYMVLKDQCTDIASEIYPHYKDMYPVV